MAGWQVQEPSPPFTDRAALNEEVKRVRQNHNLTPDNVIEATAWTLRRYCSRADLERVLARLPEGAARFWHVEISDPAKIEPRIL